MPVPRAPIEDVAIGDRGRCSVSIPVPRGGPEHFAVSMFLSPGLTDYVSIIFERITHENLRPSPGLEVKVPTEPLPRGVQPDFILLFSPCFLWNVDTTVTRLYRSLQSVARSLRNQRDLIKRYRRYAYSCT